MSEKKIRVTKSNRFEDIKAMLRGEQVQHGTTLEIAIAAIDHELELLKKKNAADPDKRSKTQEENEKHKENILQVMEASDSGYTCSDILRNLPELGSTQKIAPLMGQLCDAGITRSEKVKGRLTFYLN